MTPKYDGIDIGDTVAFRGALLRQGYQLNKLASSLTEPDNREEFLANENVYMDRFDPDGSEKALVAARNWQGLLEAGGNVYLLLKITATVGSNLLEMGAAMRAEIVAEFMVARRGEGLTQWVGSSAGSGRRTRLRLPMHTTAANSRRRFGNRYSAPMNRPRLGWRTWHRISWSRSTTIT